MAGAKDAAEISGSEGDEDDPEADSEDGLGSVGEVAPVVPLRFNLGSLAEANLSSSKKKKAAPKKGGKKPGAGLGDTGTTGGVPEGDELMETGGDETPSLELFNEIEARKDTQLRQVRHLIARLPQCRCAWQGCSQTRCCLRSSRQATN